MHRPPSTRLTLFALLMAGAPLVAQTQVDTAGSGALIAEAMSHSELMANLEHLSDAIPHAPITVTDRTQLARLLLGFNLLLAHLAQISGRLAHQADTGTGSDLSGLPAKDCVALTQSLATVSCRLEESSALFKEAHIAATSAARRKARR